MKDASPTSVLCWPKRLLSADDLRRHLTSQRELVLLPRTVVTPLAADELRARGVRVRWETSPAVEAAASKWFLALEKSDASIVAAIQAMEREGIVFHRLDAPARKLAETLVANFNGGVVFTSDPATVACVANKVAGVRAAMVGNAAQASRAKKNLGANLYAVEIAGPSFFEVRQILRILVTGSTSCPESLAKTLGELDGHAHR